MTQLNWDIQWLQQEDFIEVVTKHFQSIINCSLARNIKEFNKNIIDPIKLTFSYFVSGESKESIIHFELFRQQDKSVNNIIGRFHQDLLAQIEGAESPRAGYDIIVPERHIYAELKNKHNTMNSSSSQKTYIKMQSTILEDDKATCYLVEVVAKKSQDVKWHISLEGESRSHEKIRRISIDKFYELLTNDPLAFKKLMVWLPITIKEILEKIVILQILLTF